MRVGVGVGGMSVSAALDLARSRLAASGLSASEAMPLVTHSLVSPSRRSLLFMSDAEMSSPSLVSLSALHDALDARCVARRPLAHITHRREFWSLDFEVSPAVLVPRADTETLVSVALSCVKPARDRSLRVLELGVGSGCVLISLLSELPGARGVGVDRSLAALSVARRNALRLGVAGRTTLLQSDWWQRLEGVGQGDFDLIVSNPPYIGEGERDALQPEVRHDPEGALFAGADGLDAYRAIADGRPSRWMANGGALALEVGAGQHDDVQRIVLERDSRLAFVRAAKDLAGHTRCVLFTKK